MFRGGFLHFLHQRKQEKMLYREIAKFATLPQLCLYTTWENLKTHNSRFWNQLSVYFNAQCHQWQSPSELFLECVLKMSTLNSLLAENLLYSRRFLIKILFSKLNIRSIMNWIVQCFTSPPTQFKLYGRRFLQVKRPNQQYQSTEGRSTKDKANNENN